MKSAPVEALPCALLKKLLGAQPQLGLIDTKSTQDLVEMYKRHQKWVKSRKQARRAARAKQLWIWTVALGFSYVDLLGTILVGMEYWAVGGAAGKHAARVTFGMLAGSLGIQAFVTYTTGADHYS